MKNQRDQLKQYRKRITVVTDREKEIARQCLANGQKDKALLALRRRKYQESLLSQTDTHLEKLEQMTSDIEFAQVQKNVMFGLQRGTEVLKLVNKEMGGLAAVEKMMEDSAEARQQQEEISEALAGRLSNLEEDEVEDELEALRQEVEGAKLPDAPNQALLPNVPVETEAERDERRRIRAKERRAELLAA